MQTSHGSWDVRSGWILREQRGEQVVFGELAPVPFFGGEAIDWEVLLKQWRNNSLIVDGQNLPGPLAFALDSLEDGFLLSSSPQREAEPIHSAALLPLSSTAQEIEKKVQSGYRAIKTKIALSSFARERERLINWMSVLPKNVFLRLDANEGLTEKDFFLWSEWIDRQSGIQFLEQPLPVQKMAIFYQTNKGISFRKIALDESIASLKNFEYFHSLHWPGYYVIKPALMGSFCGWRDAAIKRSQKVVLSSVFETAIGFSRLLAMSQIMGTDRPVEGFGTRGFFTADDWDGYPPSPCWNKRCSTDRMESIWKEL